jgi:hypothetical protein
VSSSDPEARTFASTFASLSFANHAFQQQSRSCSCASVYLCLEKVNAISNGALQTPSFNAGVTEVRAVLAYA